MTSKIIRIWHYIKYNLIQILIPFSKKMCLKMMVAEQCACLFCPPCVKCDFCYGFHTSHSLLKHITLIMPVIIGTDHDTVCAGVVGTAIRHSTSCAGHLEAACSRAGQHNECCAGLQYQPRRRRPYKWSISILPRSQFYTRHGKLAFSTSSTAVRPIDVCVTTHDDGTASDVTIGMWHHNHYPTLAREFQGFRVWGKFVFRMLELTDTPTNLANQVKVGHALDHSRSV